MKKSNLRAEGAYIIQVVYAHRICAFREKALFRICAFREEALFQRCLAVLSSDESGSGELTM